MDFPATHLLSPQSQRGKVWTFGFDQRVAFALLAIPHLRCSHLLRRPIHATERRKRTDQKRKWELSQLLFGLSACISIFALHCSCRGHHRCDLSHVCHVRVDSYWCNSVGMITHWMPTARTHTHTQTDICRLYLLWQHSDWAPNEHKISMLADLLSVGCLSWLGRPFKVVSSPRAELKYAGGTHCRKWSKEWVLHSSWGMLLHKWGETYWG